MATPAEKKSSRTRYLTYSLVILAAFAAGIVLAWTMQQWRSETPVSPAGVEAYGGDFELEATWGKSGLPDYRGKLVLIYFGFTSCPDVCPTSLGTMKAAMAELDAAEQAQVRGLFITVDPERDTPQRIEQYAQYFHPNFHGLSGTPADIAHVAKQYGVIYRKVETPESSMPYTMDHSSVIYVVDQQGALKAKVQHGATPTELAAKIREYL